MSELQKIGHGDAVAYMAARLKPHLVTAAAALLPWCERSEHFGLRQRGCRYFLTGLLYRLLYS